MSNPTESTGESKAQEQARLRRERRNAKLQAGGSDRLNKIMASSGRNIGAEAELSKSQPQSTSNQSNDQSAEDPAEMDISNIQKPPEDMSTQEQQDLFRQMLAATNQSQNGAQSTSGQDSVNDDSMEQMMKQMQQMLGTENVPGGDDLPNILGNLMNGNPVEKEPERDSNHVWRIVHAIFAIILGLFAAINLSLNGWEAVGGSQSGSRFFWIFTTSELVLQSTRYFIDGGKLPVTGMLGGIVKILPEPYSGYIRIYSRYSVIFMTILNDVMVIIFVLGVISWWNGHDVS